MKKSIVVALFETTRLMVGINRVIETLGGWLGAFQLTDAGKGSAK